MEAAEIEQWRKIDVGSFNGTMSIFLAHLCDIKDTVKAGGKQFTDYKDMKNERYEALKNRFDSIDLRMIDPRLPRCVIGILKHDIIPKLGEKFRDLEEAVAIYKEDGLLEIMQHVIAEKVEDCRFYLKRMMQQSQRFREWPGYESYRRTNPKRNYLYGAVA
ncbi:hypothetical protein KY325_03770 [Candidatus Woesearchaeota archaeon]|nr:hypothetical protein [Candidatus Woesearchaeota archaeon]MBW3018251.1 hypothetical protein [Candidatus Woesearchaeota archaeon]